MKQKKIFEDVESVNYNVESFISTLWAICLHRNEIIYRKAKPNPHRTMTIFEGTRIRNASAEEYTGW